MSANQVCCPTARLEKLLLATDGSKLSEGAEKETINLAKICSSKIYALSVIEVNPEFLAAAPQLVEKNEKEVRKHLEKVKTKATSEGLDCEIIVHQGEEPFKYIVDEAAKKKVAMTIMGRHGRTGLKRLLMGSVAAKTVGHSPCDVMVIPQAAKVVYKKILVATDGSKYSDAASFEAVSIAKRCNSDLIALSVATKDTNLAAAKESVEKVRQLADREGVKVESLAFKGMPYEVIVDTAVKKGADLIVVGSHGRTGVKRLLMGSVTERVIGHSECGVLVAVARS
jgi:nucleotide-binding universal stress UspA family protein